MRRAIVYRSRAGRPFEVALWSNGLASVGVGVVAYLAGGWPVGVAVLVIAFALLRVSLVSCRTLWIAAMFGTLAVGALGGGLAWLFGHVVDIAGFASIAAIIGATLAAAVPAWAYSRLAERRMRAPSDSLIDPISAASSR